MKSVRPLFPAIILLGLCTGVVAALACDQSKSKGASASAASNTACSAASCPSSGKGASATAINTAFDQCSGKSGSTAGYDHCSGKTGAATTASATGACSGHAAAAAHMCTGQGSATAGNLQHSQCSYCNDLEACEQEMHSLGATLQVVSLKNGVMYLFTTAPSHVRSVQLAMARRKESGAMFASTAEEPHLCDNCRALRGAAASGKLTREVVNIDGGCLTLMTSNDPAVVARIHELAGITSTRTKS